MLLFTVISPYCRIILPIGKVFCEDISGLYATGISTPVLLSELVLNEMNLDIVYFRGVA